MYQNIQLFSFQLDLLDLNPSPKLFSGSIGHWQMSTISHSYSFFYAGLVELISTISILDLFPPTN